MDAFTERRLLKFVTDFQARSGVPPTLQDFEKGGFTRELIETAVRKSLLEMYYVNLTSGPIVKTYRIKKS